MKIACYTKNKIILARLWINLDTGFNCHSAVKVVKTLYDRDYFLCDSVMPQDFPKTVSMNAIKCLFKIH